MKKKRAFGNAVVILAAASILVFSGCSRKSESTGKTSKTAKTEIVYFSRGEPVLLKIWVNVAEEFMKKNPDIKVRIENLDYGAYWSKLLTLMAAGTPPDVIFLESNRMTSYILKDSLTDLTPFIEKDRDFNINDFFSIGIKPYMRGGKLYGLPNDVAAQVIFYNKDLFNKAGLPFPKDNWTWDDMLKDAQAMTLDFNNDGRIDQYGIAYYDADAAVFQNGGKYYDNPENPQKCLMNLPENLEAYQFCKDLTYKYHVQPTQTEYQDTDGRTMFSLGRVAMIPDGHWSIPRYMKEAKNFKWDVQVYPKKKRIAGLGRGSCFAIPSGSKNKDAAFRFIRFITGYDGQKILMESQFSMPALKKIAYSKLFMTPANINKKAFITMTESCEMEAKLLNYEEINSTIQRELDNVWLDKEPTQTVLERLAKKINELIKNK
jgi:multiple sugar transport system substrate-binding protein